MTVSISGHLGTRLVDTINNILLAFDALVCIVHLLLQIILCGLEPVGFVDDILYCRPSRGQHSLKFSLLSNQSSMLCNYSIAFSDGLVNIGLSLSNLVLVLLFVLGELSAFEVGLNGQPDLHPLPSLGDHHCTQSSLAGVKCQLLVHQFLELHPGCLSTGTSLKPGQDGSNLVFPLLLHPATNTSPEEDLSVSKPELLLV